MSELNAIGGDVAAALESVSVPTYVLDPTGVIRWVNPAAERLVGDVRGRQFTSVVAPEETRRAREHFARNLVGTAPQMDTEVVVLDTDGNRVSIEVSSVRLMRGHCCVGVFGQVADVEDLEDDPPHPSLTPRQSGSPPPSGTGPFNRRNCTRASSKRRDRPESRPTRPACSRRPQPLGSCCDSPP
jgi:PAS domain S-box-containing protein